MIFLPSFPIATRLVYAEAISRSYSLYAKWAGIKNALTTNYKTCLSVSLKMLSTVNATMNYDTRLNRFNFP